MRFITMGPEEFPTLLFIHGLSTTAESCYGKVSRCLQDQWHIVLCELDGHYDGSPVFQSIDDECKQIEAYVSENHQGRIHGMVGLSLGGTIAVSLLSRGRILSKEQFWTPPSVWIWGSSKAAIAGFSQKASQESVTESTCPVS